MQQLFSIHVDNDLRELAPHGSYAFPMEVYLDDMDQYDLGQIRWHWHEELEFVVMQRGRIDHQVGENHYILGPGQGLIINSNQLHMAQSVGAPGGMFHSVLVDPALISGHLGSAIHNKYMEPLLQCESLQALVLNAGVPWQAEVMHKLTALSQAYEEAAYGYELVVRNLLGSLWLDIALGTRELVNTHASRQPSQDEERIKKMLRFIHGAYAEELTLVQIAQAANISVSECCRCFGRMLGVTPVAYLIQHRVSVAARLLAEEGYTISDVAHASGFDTLSYFSKKFREQYGSTPSQYRRGLQKGA